MLGGFKRQIGPFELDYGDVIRGAREMFTGLGRAWERGGYAAVGRKATSDTANWLKAEIAAWSPQRTSTGTLVNAMRKSWAVVGRGMGAFLGVCSPQDLPDYWVGVNWGSFWRLEGKDTVRYAMIDGMLLEIERHGPGMWYSKSEGRAFPRSARGKEGAGDEWIETANGTTMLDPKKAGVMREGYNFTDRWATAVEAHATKITSDIWDLVAASVSRRSG